jgi:anti-anti-sigma regulatory factor
LWASFARFCRVFQDFDHLQPTHLAQNTGMAPLVLGLAWMEEFMLNVTVENIGDLAVVECEGRLVQSEAAFKLRQAVISQSNARIVVLELSEVHAIENGGLGMLVFLRQWARDHNIRFMLFNPSQCVRDGLKRVRAISEFYIPTLDDMMALLTYADCQYAAA